MNHMTKQISAENGEIINSSEVRLHDYILNEFRFDRATRELSLLLLAPSFKLNVCILRFMDVIGFEMTACNYWGESPHIHDFCYLPPEKAILLPQLFSKAKNTDAYSTLQSQEHYIETTMAFSSGDTLTVACSHILIL